MMTLFIRVPASSMSISMRDPALERKTFCPPAPWLSPAGRLTVVFISITPSNCAAADTTPRRRPNKVEVNNLHIKKRDFPAACRHSTKPTAAGLQEKLCFGSEWRDGGGWLDMAVGMLNILTT